MTGQVAVGLVGVLAVAAIVYGVGVASAKYDLADVGAWLSARSKGAVVHVNGPAAKVDGKTAVVPQMRGHRIRVVQDGATVLVIDLDTGVVSRLDPAQLKVDTSRPLGAGLQVLAAAGRAYTVDSAKGLVQQIDPVTLVPAGASATLPAPLGQAGIDGRGALWVPVPSKGQVAPFAAGRLQTPVSVGKAGDSLALTIAAGDPVVTDSTAATATVVKPSGTRLTVALPTTVRRAGAGGVLAPPATTGTTVPLLVPGTGSLVTVDTGTGRYTSARLALPKHRYQPPQMLGAKVYIPDETAGSLLVYDAAANRFEAPVPVTGRPSTLEVFVRDGLLWANDPSGPRAVVIDDRGGRKRIDKYRDRVPGGPKRHAIPTPGGQGAPPPLRAPQSPPPPRPGQPPTAPSNLTVTPGSGTMRVDFQPAQGEGITGYVLKGAAAGLSVAPRAIAANAGAYTFTVKGGSCGTEYRFRVAVRYRDARGRTGERVSQAGDPVRPCVTPGAPRGLTAQAASGGARLAWTAPAGAGTTGYKIAWDGALTGSATATGTSATLAQVATNGSYTFTVAATNAAGAGTGTSITAKLAGPAVKYPVQNNGKSYGYLYSTPNATSGTEIGSMFDNNGTKVPVNCQVQGVKYTHPKDSSLTGAMYVNITYGGKTGYVIGYLVDTPGAWTSYAGPPVWKCGP
ncbi:fibronectin type III domain-containing protein [Actinomadura violacea]|uniref:Fibronectin type-III domain-containing protein n=1 Tax=Actinomadura violacea TaxID=2819934 RepID=A0ABS3RL48_9ACTN|nr:hypothetical protein [Actinomadura violacea]MBO2457397.1 hypothetical protein [Actinomadura violacea]